MQLLTMIKRRERGIRCAHSLRIAGEVRAKQNQAGTSKASFQMRPPDDFAEREGFFLRCAAKATEVDCEPIGVLAACLSVKTKKEHREGALFSFCGERGIRTHGTQSVQRFSRPPRSTTPASLQWSFVICECKITIFFGFYKKKAKKSS